VDLADQLRKPGAAALVVGAASGVLIALRPGAAPLIAMLALNVYPILDLPRVLVAPSWWRAAFVSAVAWLLLLLVLGAVVDAIQPLGAAGMIFLLPFMTFPLLLAASGIARLEARLRGRPPAAGQRLMVVLTVLVFAAFVGLPLALVGTAAVREKVTGNSPPNTLYSVEGTLLAAGPRQVRLQREGGRVETIGLRAATVFDFRGPGSGGMTGPPGPDRLAVGQRLRVEFVRRAGQAEAERVEIWIDAAPSPPP
jgi:hypothetical protein